MWSLEILRYHFRASNRHQTLADLLVIEVISRANIGIQPRGQQVLHTEPEASECPNNTNYSMSCGWLMMVGLIGLGNWTSRKFHRSPALNVWRRVIPETRETMGDHGRPWETTVPNGSKWLVLNLKFLHAFAAWARAGHLQRCRMLQGTDLSYKDNHLFIVLLQDFALPC